LKGRDAGRRRGATPRRSAALALALAAAPGALAAAPFPPPVHQTRIVATWDPATRTLTGSERLRWRNGSSAALDELVFHHYLNAFANDRSTFLRGSGGSLRSVRFAGSDWGFLEVTALRLADGTDLAPRGAYVAPDDGNPHDRTVARYPLPQPLPPGGWIEVEIDFVSRLPRVFLRAGARGDYAFAGGWYPHIAVFEDAGEGGRATAGWNAHQHHATSEFFADFGDYDVTLTLPERYRGRVGATGRQVSEEVAGGEVTVRFLAQGVHDFAWTADPRFRVIHDRFEPEADVPATERRRIARLLGVGEEELALEPVDIQLLIHPANAGQAGRYLGAAKAALATMGLRLGAYPWDTLTLVDPPLGGYGSAGMEYPTLVTLGTHPLLALPGLRGVLVPETVTLHEVAHQWFQGMIASNEAEESWLDEGPTSYYEGLMTVEQHGPALARAFGVEITPREYARAGGLTRRAYADPVVRPAWRYLGTGSYAANSYDRPALVLAHLEGLLGEETFHRALRAFFQEHRFTHPTGRDLEAALERAAGRDLGWFFRQALHSTRVLDYQVRPIARHRVRPPRGVRWVDGERREPAEDEDGDPEAGAGTAGPTWSSRVVVFREGEFRHPVTVELRFADGSVRREAWDGQARWARWTFRGPALASAEVDPDHLLVLDADRLDNGATAEPRHGPVLALLLDLALLIQGVFAGLGLLA
jgi:hypothetical protein